MINSATPLSARACPGCGRETPSRRCEFCGCALLAGSFVIQTIIAQTPHSRVYSVTDASGQAIALKEIHFANVPDAATLDAFERESETLQRLKHPAIPKHHGNFSEGEGVARRLYIAFAWVPGESLATRLVRGRLPEALVRAIGDAVLEILVYLQSQLPAVLHRDVKPGNIMLGENGAVSLVDFGSVRHMEGSRTHRSTLVGTYGYMPPEQLGGSVDLSSDVYGLAATLLHAVTGKAPGELYASDLKVALSPLVPGTLRGWMLKALDRDPTKRFHDAAEALAAFRHPELLKPPPPPPRVGLAAAVGLALAAVVMVGVRYWDATRPVEATQPVPPSTTRPLTWYEQHKSHCNQVEVGQLFAESPPPTDPKGTGYGAACLSLAGKIEKARELIYRLQPNDRFIAIQLLFNLVHPVADKGDDAATGPIMKLVVEFWPNNYMALFHLGIAEYVAGSHADAKVHLKEFLKLYNTGDSFTQRAQRALSRIEAGIPAEPGETSAH